MSNETPALAEARARMMSLRIALAPPGAAPLRLIETHISWILLGEALAWKLKKPLTLPFIDMAPLTARQQACAEELRLNRRLAPQLYLGIDAVHAGPSGPVIEAFDGQADAAVPAGPLIDAAVRMRRFPDGALWSERLAAGRLAAPEVEAMAHRLARFHDEAPVAPSQSPHGSAQAQAHVTAGLVAAMDGWHAAAPPSAEAAAWPPLRQWLVDTLDRLGPFFAQRRAAGRVREGHGDLHLANLLWLDGAPAAFDAIDFDPALRWIDVLDDVAFTVMDLLAHGAPALAWRFLDAWLTHTGDHAGLPGLRFHLVCRALVRAQVAALAPAGRPGPALPAARYRALAAELAAGADPRLAITHGLPGSGKSHAALRLVEAGAIRLRSDVERKRLFGLAALDRSRGQGAAIYGPEATRQTYARLHTLAGSALAAGWPVVVDAAFLQRDEREPFAALAQAAGVPHAVVDCRAPLAVLRTRLTEREARGDDASEADIAVLERLRAVAEPLAGDEPGARLVVDAERPDTLGRLAERWRALPPPA